ncbi:MAG TPA: hypothetical protein VMV18_13275, partial [bacterium]|nr:hypothetical protein [bacterium]
MGAVLLIHLDRVVRERIEDALKARGLSVLSSVDVESALELAEKAKVTAVLVDPRILVKEPYDISARFASRAGGQVRIIALTHVAGALEAQAFQRHGASLLIAPLESLDLLALYLGTDTPMPGESERRDEHLPAEKGAAGPSVQMSEEFDIPEDPTGLTEPAPAPAPAAHEVPDEVTNVQRAPADAAAPPEEPITPEMEAALERARAEVRRIREEHEAERKSGVPPVRPPTMTPSALLRGMESSEPWTQPTPRPDPKEELAAIAAPKRPSGGAPRVLVIEDDLGCRDFFQDVLAARGYHVHSCASVPAAIRYIQ